MCKACSIIHYTLFIIPNGVRLAHETLEKLSIPSRARSYIYTTPHPHLQPSLQTELPKGYPWKFKNQNCPHLMLWYQKRTVAVWFS